MTKFNKALADDMKSGFNKAQGKLEDISIEVNQIANDLAGGCLLGLTGDALYDALNGTLKSAVDRLSYKMGELAADVENAREEYERAEYENWLRYNNSNIA